MWSSGGSAQLSLSDGFTQWLGCLGFQALRRQFAGVQGFRAFRPVFRVYGKSPGAPSVNAPVRSTLQLQGPETLQVLGAP